MDLEKPNRGPTAARLIVVVFLCVMAATALFSWVISGNVRQDAKLADEHLRTVAWAVLLHVEGAGRFPTSQQELAATPFAAEASVDAAGRWPATAEQAGVPAAAQERWAVELAESLRRLDVRFSTDPRQPPNLTAGGRATGLGTLVELNGWLRGRADALAAAASGPTQ